MTPTRIDTRKNLLLAALGVTAVFTALTASDVVIKPSATVNQVEPGVQQRITELSSSFLGTAIPLIGLGSCAAVWGVAGLWKGGDRTVQNLVDDAMGLCGGGRNALEKYVPKSGHVFKIINEVSTSFDDETRSMQILSAAAMQKRLTFIASTDSGKTFTMLLMMWLRNQREVRGDCEALPLYICDIKFGTPDRRDKSKKLTWGDYHVVNPQAVKRRAEEIRQFLHNFDPSNDTSPGLVILPELQNVQLMESMIPKEEAVGKPIGDSVKLILNLGDSYGKGLWVDSQSDLVGDLGINTRSIKAAKFMLLGDFTHDLQVLKNVAAGRDRPVEDIARICKGLVNAGKRPFVYVNGAVIQIGVIPYMPDLLDKKWAAPKLVTNPYDNPEVRGQILGFIQSAGKIDCKTRCADQLFGLKDRSGVEYKEQFSVVFEQVAEEYLEDVA